MVELKSSPELSGVDWHGLLSLFSRTLPAKMFYLAIRETLSICKIFFVTILFLFLFLVFCFALFFVCFLFLFFFLLG